MLSFAQATGALDKLIDRDQDFRLLGAGFGFTEGPAWNTSGNYLVFSDIPGDRRWRWSEQGGMELDAWPTYKGNGMAYEPDGSLLVCEQVTSSLIRIRPDGLRQVVAFHYQGKYLNSPNDVIVRSDGSIYFTDPNYGRWPVAVGVARECELDFQGVFRVPPGGGDAELVVAEKEFEQPNGLCLLARRKHPVRQRPAEPQGYDVAADGSLSNVRVVHDQMGSSGVPGNGNPDGMEVRRARQRLVHRPRRDLGARPGRRPARDHRDARGVRQPGLGRRGPALAVRVHLDQHARDPDQGRPGAAPPMKGRDGSDGRQPRGAAAGARGRRADPAAQPGVPPPPRRPRPRRLRRLFAADGEWLGGTGYGRDRPASRRC